MFIHTDATASYGDVDYHDVLRNLEKGSLLFTTQESNSWKLNLHNGSISQNPEAPLLRFISGNDT
ncbi:hypothetical protein EAF00_009606 [Botryotinia globosa]|nr:hypothetical protein EAF00_009606 [Botryotinia globosa]